MNKSAPEPISGHKRHHPNPKALLSTAVPNGIDRALVSETALNEHIDLIAKLSFKPPHSKVSPRIRRLSGMQTKVFGELITRLAPPRCSCSHIPTQTRRRLRPPYRRMLASILDSKQAGGRKGAVSGWFDVPLAAVPLLLMQQSMARTRVGSVGHDCRIDGRALHPRSLEQQLKVGESRCPEHFLQVSHPRFRQKEISRCLRRLSARPLNQ